MHDRHVNPLDPELSLGKEGRVGMHPSVSQHDVPIFTLILWGRLILPLMSHWFCGVQDITYDFEAMIPKAKLSVYTAPHTEPEGQVSLVPVHESDKETHCVQESEYPEGTRTKRTSRPTKAIVMMEV